MFELKVFIFHKISNWKAIQQFFLEIASIQ